MSFRGGPRTVPEQIGDIYEQLRRLYLRVPPAAEPGGSGCGPWAATVVVAASDSRKKDCADLVCTGSADQDTINAAIGLLPNRGGRVLLLEGNYAITGTIYLDKWECTIEGQNWGQDAWNWTGGGTRLYIPDQTNLAFPVFGDTSDLSNPPPHPPGTFAGGAARTGPFLNNEGGISGPRQGLVLRNFCIDGNGFNQALSATIWNHGIYSDNTLITVENVSVLQMGGAGIVVYGDVFSDHPAVIRNCFVLGSFTEGIVIGANVLCVGNTISQPGQDYWGDQVFGGPPGAGIVATAFNDDNNIIGNFLSDITGDGIRILGGSTAQIIGNIINGFAYAVETEEEIGDAFAGIRISDGCTGIMIANNTIWNGSACGILLDGLSYGGDDLVEIKVEGNRIHDNAGPGIRVKDSHHVMIQNNQLFANAYENFFGSSILWDEMQLEGDTYECMVMGNQLRDGHDYPTAHGWLANYGISLDASTHDNWLVLNDIREIAYGWTAGAYLDNGTNNDNTSGGNLT